ncbi:hypothetical protein ACLKA6_000772 [Drosophila palustris]
MSLTAGTVARSDSSEWLLPVKPSEGGAKCTTVTMLLAQRIARNDCWSVDDETCYRSNKMNVWQTLEYLSGLSLRKRYNYEGFADTQNLIRTLTPSWRRDSYAEKTKAEDVVASVATVGGGGATAKYVDDQVSESVAAAVASNMVRRRTSPSPSSDHVALSLRAAALVAAPRRKRRSRKKRPRNLPRLNPEYALTAEDLQDLVKCT